MRIIETKTIEEPIEEYTDEQILAICCEEVDADPCFKAGERTEEMSALPQDSEDYPEETLALIEKAKEHHSGTKSDPLIVIRNEDRKNPCGEQETKYVRTGSCCDEVALLEIDEDSLPSAISDYSEALILLAAPSELPFTVQVRGSGFYADRNYSARDVQYSGGDMFKVYTADACGPCTITVSDGCSEAVITVFSTDGRWSDINISTGLWDHCIGWASFGAKAKRVGSFSSYVGAGGFWDAYAGDTYVRFIVYWKGTGYGYCLCKPVDIGLGWAECQLYHGEAFNGPMWGDWYDGKTDSTYCALCAVSNWGISGVDQAAIWVRKWIC